MATARRRRPLRLAVILPMVWLMGAGYAVSDEEEDPPASPITRQGRQLREDGDPWRAVGFHCPDVAFGPGSACAQTPHMAKFRRHQRAVVEHALSMGASVLRVGAYQSVLVDGPNPYRHLDRLVTYARGAGLRLLLVLETHAPVCPSVDREKDLGWYHSGWREPYGSYRMSLPGHASELAMRYRYEPTVMGYELVEGAPPGAMGVILNHLHGEVSRAIRASAAHPLIVSGARLDCSQGRRGMEDWLCANRVGLVDAVTIDDLEEPHVDLPECVSHAMAGASILNRPLFVTAAGIRKGVFPARTRAQKLVDKAATAAELGVSLYTVSSLGSALPAVEAFGVDVAEPLARSLPHLAATRFAQVVGCADPQACPVNFWAVPDPPLPPAMRVEALAGY